MPLSMVLLEIHGCMSAGSCQARVNQGTSSYLLHARYRIVSVESYGFLYNLFMFLAPSVGKLLPPYGHISSLGADHFHYLKKVFLLNIYQSNIQVPMHWMV